MKEEMDWTPLPFQITIYETHEEFQQIIQTNENRIPSHTFLLKKAESHLPIVILLGDAGEYNPYHLFFYMIVRFRYVDDGKTTITYYYKNKRNTYICESALRCLPPRFQRSQEAYNGIQYVELPFLNWYPEFIEETWIYSYIKELYAPIFSSYPRVPKKYTYISRAKSASRQLKNESQLVDQLKCLGFSLYCMEDLTFEEQIRLFHSSEVICGIHSGAFAFLAFCDPGTKVFELFWDSQKNKHYFDISIKCNLQFLRYTSLRICNEETQEVELLHTSDFLNQLETFCKS